MKIKILNFYFIILILGSVIGIYLIPNNLINLIPIIVLINAPILNFYSFYKNYYLSKKIKIENLTFHEKYKYKSNISYLNGNIISVLNYYSNKDIFKLDKNTIQEINFLKKLLQLSFLTLLFGSFVAILIILKK